MYSKYNSTCWDGVAKLPNLKLYIPYDPLKGGRMKDHRGTINTIIVSILLIATIAACIVGGTATENGPDQEKGYYVMAGMMLNLEENDKELMLVWVEESDLSENEKTELKQGLIDAWERYPDNNEDDLNAAKKALDISVAVAEKEKAAKGQGDEWIPEMEATSPANTYSIEKDPHLIEIRGDLPVFTSEEQKQECYSNLDAIHKATREDIKTYRYPNGPVIGNGWNIEGCYSVMLRQDVEITNSQIDEIYELINKNSMKISGKEVPVAFIKEGLAVDDTESQSSNTTPGFSALTLLMIISLMLIFRPR